MDEWVTKCGILSARSYVSLLSNDSYIDVSLTFELGSNVGHFFVDSLFFEFADTA